MVREIILPKQTLQDENSKDDPDKGSATIRSGIQHPNASISRRTK